MLNNSIKKILIIDDSYLMRKSILHLLKVIDVFEVVGEAEGIEDGIEYIDKLEPDFIILDYQMRSGTGIDLLKYIKDKDLKIKVIMLSNYGDEKYKKLALENGAIAYLEKSLETDQLIDSILSIVKSQ
jgi:DNA-binding NarL/FixJ family response regulator